MVVNNRDEQSQNLHHLLNERLINITLYAQDLSQPDVWQTVNAEKDDILVYDRFGSSLIQFNSPSEHDYLINMPLNTLFYQVWPTHLPSVSSLHHPEPPTCGGGYNTYLLWWYLWRVQRRGKTLKYNPHITIFYCKTAMCSTVIVLLCCIKSITKHFNFTKRSLVMLQHKLDLNMRKRMLRKGK